MAIDHIADALRVDATGGAASPEDVRALIDELLDDEKIWARLASSERAEIAGTSEWVAACRSGHREWALSRTASRSGEVRLNLAPEWANVAAARVAGPYYALRGARLLEDEAAIADAYDSGDYARILHRLPPAGPQWRRDGIFGADWVTREPEFVNEPRAWLPAYAQIHMMRRLAAVHLAVRLYAQSNQGRIPASLDSLVPDYLPVVPNDLFARGGAARIKYVPTAAHPFVYSVGDNGIDDFAAGLWTPPAGLPFQSRLTLPDLIWYVAPAGAIPMAQAPSPAPATTGSARSQPRMPTTTR